MKKIYSFLLLGLLLSIGNAWGATSTLTFTAGCGGSGTASDNAVWTVTSDAEESVYDAARGIHYGTTNKTVQYIQLTTSDIPRTISQVVVNASDATGTATISVTVGGSSFTGDATTVTNSNPGNNYTFTGSASGEIVVLIDRGAAAKKALYVKSIVVTYEDANPTVATPTFSIVGGTFSSEQTVSINCATTGATIYYTLDGSTPTTSSNVYTSALTISTTTTLKAFAVKSGMADSEIQSANYFIVTVEHAGTQADPYSVADARNAIDLGTGVNNVYATGIVSEITTEYNSQFSNISFNIVDEEGDETFLQAYRCGGDDAINVVVGDIVVVSGNLIKYGQTYEFTSGCQIVSLQHPVLVDPVINAENVNLTCDATSGEIAYTISNPTQGSLIATSTTDWISNIQVTANKVTFTTTANDGDIAREGFITLTYTGAEPKVITILQAAPEGPNFTWDLSSCTEETIPYHASETMMIWTNFYATAMVEKGTASTNANNYYPCVDDRTSTRFYKNSILTITPASGYPISSIEFEATNANYATALKNSAWTNATATANDTKVTVVPTNGAAAMSAVIGGTCGFTSIKVYYTGPVAATLTLGTNGWSTYSAFFNYTVSGANVYTAAPDDEENPSKIVLTQVTENAVIAAEEGIILKGEEGATVTITPSDVAAELIPGNALFDTSDAVAVVSEGFGAYVLSTFNGVTAFNPCGDITIPMNKAYLMIAPSATQAPIRIEFAENNATNIESLKGNENVQKFFENGQVRIIREGVVYDATGRVVR